MPVFLERFIVPLCVALLGVLILNQMKLDGPQRVSLIVALVAIAYFASHTVFKKSQTRDIAPANSTTVATAQQAQEPKQEAPPAAAAAPLLPRGPGAGRGEPVAAVKKPRKNEQAVGKVTQSSTGANSPNIATFGPNSPVSLNLAPPPWSLSEVQQQAFADAVRPYRDLWDGRFSVVICVMGDPESMRMAESFVSSFRAAGWELPNGGFAQGIFSPVPVGVGMSFGGTEPPTGRARELINAVSNRLRQLGVIFDLMDLEVATNQPVGEFQIRVGRRPDR